jgi:hypothetical protein
MSPPPTLSPAGTLVDGGPKELPLFRKLVLLVVFCLAQFLDAINNSALFSALPALEISMGMTESQSTWMISAFQLTFASFLLIVRAHPLNYVPFQHIVFVNFNMHCRVAVSAMYTTQVSTMPSVRRWR